MVVWSGYLNLARLLVGLPADEQPCNESIKRSAISRAYYSAFNEAMIHLVNKDGLILNRTENKHKIICDAFLQSVDPAKKSIGFRLKSLRLKRNGADYGEKLRNIDAQAVQR